jgi:ATP-dependent Zn protease
MDDNFFNLSLSTLGRYTDNTPFADQINSRVKEWIDQATEKAKLTVEQHWEKISFVAETLLEEETMTHDQLKSILD